MNHRIGKSDQTDKLRGTLGQFPTGVAIVTALTDNFEPVGMTINSFNSVSLTPPLISWCIDNRSVSFKVFVKAESFTVTVLAENQADLGMRFATRGANKFPDTEFNYNDAPVIPNSCAWFKCKAYRSILLGDHTMLVGRVVEFARFPRQPLVFKGGRFQQPMQTAQAETQAAA